MTTLQKRAWFNLAVVALGFAAFLVLDETRGHDLAGWAFVLFSLSGLARFIGWRSKPDERDLAIERHALRAGLTMSYCVFFAGCLGILAVKLLVQHQDHIHVAVLGWLLVGAAGGFLLTTTLTTLLLYHRHVEAEPEGEKP